MSETNRAMSFGAKLRQMQTEKVKETFLEIKPIKYNYADLLLLICPRRLHPQLHVSLPSAALPAVRADRAVPTPPATHSLAPIA